MMGSMSIGLAGNLQHLHLSIPYRASFRSFRNHHSSKLWITGGSGRRGVVGVGTWRRKPISAVDEGVEASISNPKENPVRVKNAKVVLVAGSPGDNKIEVRVEVGGVETDKIFGKVLADLARSAPPVPGFRREKGGKTSKVPRDFLLQILGEERVTNFVIQEIVSSTMADYADKERLKVKENKIETVQKADELNKLFKPGKEFGFNVILELEEAENETPD